MAIELTEKKGSKQKNKFDNILNSSQSPIHQTEEEKDADLLFMEDEAKYDSLL